MLLASNKRFAEIIFNRNKILDSGLDFLPENWCEHWGQKGQGAEPCQATWNALMALANF